MNGSTVSVRISIGTALGSGLLGEATVDEADRDLYRQKLQPGEGQPGAS